MSYADDEASFSENEPIPIADLEGLTKELILFVKKAIKEDSHIKLISIRCKKVVTDKFLDTLLCPEKLDDMVKDGFPIDSVQGVRCINKKMFGETASKILFEWKTKIFSKLADEGIMALFYNHKKDSIFWAFPDGLKIRDEKQYLKDKNK